MMEGWEEIRIGELGKVVTGNTPPKKDPKNYGGTYPFIKPTDMEIDRKTVSDWEENYSEKAYDRYYRSYIPPKATGVVTIGTVGEKIFQADKWCFTNQSVNVVIPNENLFDPDFVFYLLKINLPKVENANPGTASGRHHVSKSNFCAIKVKIPKNIHVQRKIAKILSAYDDLIENNLKRIKLLGEMAQKTYEEWFVFRKIDNELIDDSQIEFQNLEELIADYMNGGWGKEDEEGSYTVPAYVIRGTDMPDISSGSFNKLPLRFHTNSNFKSRELQSGDVIIEMSNGNINNVGRSFYYDRDFNNLIEHPAMCASFCKMVRPKSVELSYIVDSHINYIYETNRMLVYKSQAANGINNFRFEDMISDEVLSIPKGELVSKLVATLKPKYELISNVRNQIRLLKAARDILLPRLMTGMIDVEKLELEL